MDDTVNLSIKYSDYPIAFFTRIFYLIRLLDLGIVQTGYGRKKAQKAQK